MSIELPSHWAIEEPFRMALAAGTASALGWIVGAAPKQAAALAAIGTAGGALTSSRLVFGPQPDGGDKHMLKDWREVLSRWRLIAATTLVPVTFVAGRLAGVPLSWRAFAAGYAGAVAQSWYRSS